MMILNLLFLAIWGFHTSFSLPQTAKQVSNLTGMWTFLFVEQEMITLPELLHSPMLFNFKLYV